MFNPFLTLHIETQKFWKHVSDPIGGLLYYPLLSTENKDEEGGGGECFTPGGQLPIVSETDSLKEKGVMLEKGVGIHLVVVGGSITFLK